MLLSNSYNVATYVAMYFVVRNVIQKLIILLCCYDMLNSTLNIFGPYCKVWLLGACTYTFQRNVLLNLPYLLSA